MADDFAILRATFGPDHRPIPSGSTYLGGEPPIPSCEEASSYGRPSGTPPGVREGRPEIGRLDEPPIGEFLLIRKEAGPVEGGGTPAGTIKFFRSYDGIHSVYLPDPAISDSRRQSPADATTDSQA